MNLDSLIQSLMSGNNMTLVIIGIGLYLFKDKLLALLGRKPDAPATDPSILVPLPSVAPQASVFAPLEGRLVDVFARILQQILPTLLPILLPLLLKAAQEALEKQKAESGK